MANNSWVTGDLILTGVVDRNFLENKIKKYRIEQREEFGYWLGDS